MEAFSLPTVEMTYHGSGIDVHPVCGQTSLQLSGCLCMLVGKDMAKHEYALLFIDKTLEASGWVNNALWVCRPAQRKFRGETTKKKRSTHVKRKSEHGVIVHSFFLQVPGD